MSGVNIPTKKPVNRRSKTKEAVSDKNATNGLEVNSQLEKLGTLKGLSIMRAAATEPALAKASKGALGDLSSQLEKRKSKEAMIADLKAAKKGVAPNQVQRKAKLANDRSVQSINEKNRNESLNPPKAPTATQDPPLAVKNKSDDETMKALLKSSLPKNLTKPVVADPNSPAVQRKILFEKLAADEKLREAKKLSKSSKTLARNSFKEPKEVDATRLANTKKLMKDSISLLTRPIKKEPELSNLTKSEVPALMRNGVGAEPTLKKNRSNHRAPQMNIKKEPVSVEELKIVENAEMPTKPHPPQQPPAAQKAMSLTPEQVQILVSQFEIKDYLSRKEMRNIAKKANLTDAQVRDWFKARRIQEETPMIVEEKHSEVQLSSTLVVVKQEPVEGDTFISESVGEVVPANIIVKQEPDDEPDSAVLDPLTGKLLKKSNVDKKIEEILAVAPVLDSLTRKIEMVKKPTSDGKAKMKNEISNIIDILDDEIEITKETIVNPGPKEKPLSKTLNKFLSQVEQLEKSMDVSEFSKNIEIETIIKESSRKDETISELTTEVNEKKNEAKYLGKELQDKNDEIESILLNSVSKETFVRTQFQSLTSEVRKLKLEKADATALQEKIRELESKLRKKNHEAEDWKMKYDSSQTLLKEKDEELKGLEETSTKMIGDITKGIGEKLALSKTRELELKHTLEKNERLEADLKDLGQTFKQQNDDLIRIKAEEKKINDRLMEKCEEMTETVQQRDEDIGKLRSENESLTLKKEEGTEAIKAKDDEIERLKEQVNSLTKRFRSKVKEIQETLSNYNETLKSKNKEIVDKAQETIDLQEQNSTQGQIIKKLKDTIGKHVQDIAKLKETEDALTTNLLEQRAALEKYKILTISPKPNPRKRKLKAEAAYQMDSKRSMLEENPEEKCFRLVNDLQFSPVALFPDLETPISIQLPLPVLSLGYNWPLVSYKPNLVLKKLQTNCSPVPEVQRPVIEENVSCKRKNVSCKRKRVSVFSSSKRFRISQANRPVAPMR